VVLPVELVNDRRSEAAVCDLEDFVILCIVVAVVVVWPEMRFEGAECRPWL
jgi:hypothetical protein